MYIFFVSEQSFNFYDKQISEKDEETGKKTRLEGSWFQRGNLLLLTGLRRGNTFYSKRYYDSIYQYAVARIEQVFTNGDLELIYERVK